MKDYFEFGDDKYIIKERSMKVKDNQYNTPHQPERKAFRRKDQVTLELILMCLLGCVAWGAFLYGLIKLMG